MLGLIFPSINNNKIGDEHKNEEKLVICKPLQRHKIRCYFCKGIKCSYCGIHAYKQLTNDTPVIYKTNSSIISDSIIAMQRPNEIFFSDKNFIDDLKAYKITVVLNLTEAGEHPYCGEGILKNTGFSYDPESFNALNIKHFNFPWKDMSVPSVDLMMKIAHFGTNEILSGGKIIIHCHAGFGRTGVAVACILIVVEDLSASEAINLVRRKRPGSIQNKKQESFVFQFYKYYKQTMVVFPTSLNHVNKSFTQSVRDQYYSLSFDEIKANERLSNLSKLLVLTVKSLKDYFGKVSPTNSFRTKSLCEFCSDILFTSFTGYKMIDKISSSKVSIRVAYDTIFNEIAEEFVMDIVQQINSNNWNIILELNYILETGITSTASMIGLRPRVDYSFSSLTHQNEIIEESDENIPKHALFVLSQLSLQFIETRTDALFESNIVNMMKAIWIASEEKSLGKFKDLSFSTFLTSNSGPINNAKQIKNRRISINETMLIEDSLFTTPILSRGDSSRMLKSSPLKVVPKVVVKPKIIPVGTLINEIFVSPEMSPRPISTVLSYNSTEKKNVKHYRQTLDDNDATAWRFFNDIFSAYFPSVKLAHVNALIELASMAITTVRENDSVTERHLNLSDLFFLRLAVASTKGVSVFPHILDDNKCLSEAFVKYFDEMVRIDGFDKLVTHSILNPFDDCHYHIVSDIVVVWKTLYFLVRNGWRYPSVQD